MGVLCYVRKMAQPPGFASTFEVAPWPVANNRPKFDDSEANKKLFGIELAKDHSSIFEAACEVFADANIAMWVSLNWKNDAIVIASKDLYLKTLELAAPVLDKHQLAAKVLAWADEVIETSSGQKYRHDIEDRLKAAELYAKINGYIGKVDIDASTKNFTHNEMKITLVDATKPIQHSEHEIIEQENSTQETVPIKLKLVSTR